MKASKEMFTIFATHVSAEALAIVRSVESMDGMQSWVKMHENYDRRMWKRLLRVLRLCTHPTLEQDVCQVRLEIVRCEGKWKAMVSELGGNSKILDLRMMWALLEICAKDVQEHVIRRDCRDVRKRHGECDIVRFEQSRAGPGGQKETAVPMEVHHLSGSSVNGSELRGPLGKSQQCPRK